MKSMPLKGSTQISMGFDMSMLGSKWLEQLANREHKLV